METLLPNLIDKVGYQDGILAPSEVDALATYAGRLLVFTKDLLDEIEELRAALQTHHQR